MQSALCSVARRVASPFDGESYDAHVRNDSVQFAHVCVRYFVHHIGRTRHKKHALHSTGHFTSLRTDTPGQWLWCNGYWRTMNDSPAVQYSISPPPFLLSPRHYR